MNPIDRDGLLAALAGVPAFLERALARVCAADLRRGPRAGGFSLVEHVWHMADLEREGYGERIRRILAEQDPELPDFEGDRIARERRYGERDAHEGLQLFSAARALNVGALRRAASADRARGATQAGVGRITLADVPRMMDEHDTSHRAEIEALLVELAR
jgi:hypothetical protein